MRAIGFAALSFGAVIALSATLGMSYRSDASPLDDPSASASDSSSPSVTDSSSATGDSATGTPTDTATPSDSGTPSDNGTPADPGTPSDSPSDTSTRADDEGGTIQPFFFVSPPPADGAALPNVSYAFGPSSVTVHGAPTAPATLAQTELWTWLPGEGFTLNDGNTCPEPNDTNDPFGDAGSYNCSFGDLEPGVYNPASEQDDGTGSPTGDYVDDYFVVPEAPSIEDINGDAGEVDLFGYGTVGDSIAVVMDGSTTVCSGVTVQDGEGGGFWSCTTPQVSFGEHDLTAFQTDQGAGQDDSILEDDPDIHYLTGGESPQSEIAEVTVDPVPAVSYEFIPGGVTATSDFGGTTATGGETDLGFEGEGFDTQVPCPWPGTNSSAGHAGVCAFSSVDPGEWWLDSYQTTPDPYAEDGVDYSQDVIAYFVIPEVPVMSATLNSARTVTFSGAGATAGDRVHIVDAGGAEACSAAPTVAANGSWSCTTAVQKVGTHNWRAVQQDITTCPNDENYFCQEYEYVSGGLSAYSPVVSVRVPAAPGSSTIPDETPVSADWTFTITGIDLNNVHPGDTFTVSGSGLPPGSTVSGELHSKTVSIGSAVVQPDGTFTLPVTVP
ncbi:MAG TPA: hypothetical protein VGM38_08995, partial [Pseudolysinimonas sp.]